MILIKLFLWDGLTALVTSKRHVFVIIVFGGVFDSVTDTEKESNQHPDTNQHSRYVFRC